MPTTEQIILDSDMQLELIKGINIDVEMNLGFNSNSSIETEISFQSTENENILNTELNMYPIMFNPDDTIPTEVDDTRILLITMDNSVIKIISPDPELDKYKLKDEYIKIYDEIKEDLNGSALSKDEISNMVKFTAKDKDFYLNISEKAVEYTDLYIKNKVINELKTRHPSIVVVTEDWYTGAKTIVFDSKQIYETTTMKNIIADFASKALVIKPKLVMTNARIIKRGHTNYAINIHYINNDANIDNNVEYDIKPFIVESILDFNYERHQIHIFDSSFIEASSKYDVDRLILKYSIMDIE